MKRIWIPILVVILAVGGFFAYRSYQTAQAAIQSSFQTEKAQRGELTATVGATGTVRANQTTMLIWQTTGSVGKLDVKLDQVVKPGQVMATLSKDTLPQEIILAEAELVDAQRALENLRNSEVQQAQAQQALVAAQKAYEDAQKARDRLDRPRASSETIQSAEANYYLAQAAVDDAEGAFNRVSGALETDVARANALANLANAKKARDKALVNLNWYKGHAGDKEYTEADANLAVAQAQLADAQREWNRLKGGPDPKDIAAAQARIAAIQATIKLSQLAAPFEASVTEVNVKVGDQVSPTSMLPAFRLDDLSRLLVDVPVSEVDINRIQVGQEVLLTFDAIFGKEYTGKITQVARVGTNTQGVVNFTVTVELTDPDQSVRPGMTAAVNIVATRLEDVLLVPNRAVRIREGKRVVYVMRDQLPEPVGIELGASSDLYSEVVSGDLKEGDLVVLNPSADLQGGSPFAVGR